MMILEIIVLPLNYIPLLIDNGLDRVRTCNIIRARYAFYHVVTTSLLFIFLFNLSYEGFEPSSVWLTANYFTIKLVRLKYTGKDLNL